MSSHHPPHDNRRRAPRKPVQRQVTVTDVIAERPMGQLGDLSATGLMIIGTDAPRTEAIYQLRLPLPMPNGNAPILDVGVQAMWSTRHDPAGTAWAGLRIISINDADAAALKDWLSPSAQ